jgi:hypothetical protein
MCASILIGLSEEWAGLHHCNETHLDLEILSSSVDRQPGQDVVSRRSREITECLLGHGVGS